MISMGILPREVAGKSGKIDDIIFRQKSGAFPCQLKGIRSDAREVCGSKIDEMTFISLTLTDDRGIHRSVICADKVRALQQHHHLSSIHFALLNSKRRHMALPYPSRKTPPNQVP